MNRKHFLIAITIASMACLNGCKSEKKATAMADTDQEVIVDSVVSTELKTDSVVFKKQRGRNVRWLWISRKELQNLTET